jgi:hypothetical protein
MQMKKRAVVDQVHESDEELRFFSPPPGPEAEPSLSSVAPSSLSPTTHSASAEGEQLLDPEQRAELSRWAARRGTLQRRVVATLCGAVVLLLLAVAAHQRAEAERLGGECAAPPPAAVVSSPVSAAPAVPTPDPAPAATPSTTPTTSVTPTTRAIASTDPSIPASTDPDALIGKARNLLRAGHTREGIAAARDALSQAPQEAEPYILLAAGLQDLGDYKAARHVFADCIQKATHGPSDSCRYFARF